MEEAKGINISSHAIFHVVLSILASKVKEGGDDTESCEGKVESLKTQMHSP